MSAMADAGDDRKQAGAREDPPRGWPRPDRSAPRIAWLLLVVLLAGADLVLAVFEAASGAWWRAGLRAGYLLLFVHLVGLLANLMQRPRPARAPGVRGWDDRGQAGLAFRYWGWPYYWLSAVLVIGVLGLAGYMIDAVRSFEPVAGVNTVLFAVFGGYLLWFLLVLRRTCPGTLVLTIDGIYHRSVGFEHFVPWHSVTAIVADEGRTQRITVRTLSSAGARTRNHLGWASRGAEGLPFMTIRAHWLGPNAVPAYLALCRYFYHPQLRAELLDPPAQS